MLRVCRGVVNHPTGSPKICHGDAAQLTMLTPHVNTRTLASSELLSLFGQRSNEGSVAMAVNPPDILSSGCQLSEIPDMEPREYKLQRKLGVI